MKVKITAGELVPLNRNQKVSGQTRQQLRTDIMSGGFLESDEDIAEFMSKSGNELNEIISTLELFTPETEPENNSGGDDNEALKEIDSSEDSSRPQSISNLVNLDNFRDPIPSPNKNKLYELYSADWNLVKPIVGISTIGDGSRLPPFQFLQPNPTQPSFIQMPPSLVVGKNAKDEKYGILQPLGSPQPPSTSSLQAPRDSSSTEEANSPESDWSSDNSSSNDVMILEPDDDMSDYPTLREDVIFNPNQPSGGRIWRPLESKFKTHSKPSPNSHRNQYYSFTNTTEENKGGELIVRHINNISSNALQSQPQPSSFSFTPNHSHDQSNPILPQGKEQQQLRNFQDSETSESKDPEHDLSQSEASYSFSNIDKPYFYKSFSANKPTNFAFYAQSQGYWARSCPYGNYSCRNQRTSRTTQSAAAAAAYLLAHQLPRVPILSTTTGAPGVYSLPQPQNQCVKTFYCTGYPLSWANNYYYRPYQYEAPNFTDQNSGTTGPNQGIPTEPGGLSLRRPSCPNGKRRRSSSPSTPFFTKERPTTSQCHEQGYEYARESSNSRQEFTITKSSTGVQTKTTQEKEDGILQTDWRGMPIYPSSFPSNTTTDSGRLQGYNETVSGTKFANDTGLLQQYIPGNQQILPNACSEVPITQSSSSANTTPLPSNKPSSRKRSCRPSRSRPKPPGIRARAQCIHQQQQQPQPQPEVEPLQPTSQPQPLSTSTPTRVRHSPYSLRIRVPKSYLPSAYYQPTTLRFPRSGPSKTQKSKAIPSRSHSNPTPTVQSSTKNIQSKRRKTVSNDGNSLENSELNHQSKISILSKDERSHQFR